MCLMNTGKRAEPTEVVHLRLPTSLLKRIAAHAWQSRRTKAGLLRWLVEEALARLPKVKP